MSIGLSSSGYFLEDIDTKERYYFKFGKMHLEGESCMVDGFGDDLAKFFGEKLKVYKETVTRTYSFNGLEGALVDFTVNWDDNSRVNTVQFVSVIAKFYIKGKQDQTGFYFEIDSTIVGYYPAFYTSNYYVRPGFCLCYMPNNPLIEGMTIYPVSMPWKSKYGHQVIEYASGGVFPVVQVYSTSAKLHQEWGDGWVQTIGVGPSQYILRDYKDAGDFSDKGRFDKQGLIVEWGFPYADGESISKGGQGEMTDTSDPIEIDSKPLLTTGDFLRVYKLTASDLTALQNKLISNGFLDGLIAKLRTDAMDYIVGLNAIPISATNVASSTIKIANLDTEINASYLSWYIEDIDFGEIPLTEYFQTFMDYSPYTKLSVYIPYCGIVPLNVDNFMNDKISLKCRVDMLTGQFVVFVSNSTGIVTTVSGSCAYQLPIRANDYNRLVTSGLGLLGGIVGTAGALATGNVPLAIGAGLGTLGGLVATSQAMTKPDVTSKGSLGGNYGLLGNRTPYLIIQRPTLSVPSDYGKTIGYMSRITAKLGDLTGYTVVEEIHLEHISATDDEKKLIENALKSGVIL